MEIYLYPDNNDDGLLEAQLHLIWHRNVCFIYYFDFLPLFLKRASQHRLVTIYLYYLGTYLKKCELCKIASE